MDSCPLTYVKKIADRGRPFASADEMNREIIERWNAIVSAEDTIYHLGDFALGSVKTWPELLSALNGRRKILIRGNHDRGTRRMLEIGFSEVYLEHDWNGWLLKHKPFKTERRLLTGHIHEKWRRLGDIINVGVDVWDFTPRTIDELAAASQSPAEYACRYCGEMLRRLEDNAGHRNGRCRPGASGPSREG